MSNFVLVVLVTLVICFSSKAEISDLPEKATYKVRSYTNFNAFHTSSRGEPAWTGTAIFELTNKTELRYLGSFVEKPAVSVGWYNSKTKVFTGAWAVLEAGWFGHFEYRWNGSVLEGPWTGYPNVTGYEIYTLISDPKEIFK